MELKPVKSINLEGVSCPMNFVMTKVAIAEILTGEILEVILDEGEALLNVPMSMKEEGHAVLNVKKDQNLFHVFFRKGED